MYVLRVIVTDQLKSYGAAKREILPGVEHRQHRYLNNRAENSHQPTRQREQRMQRFKSPGHAQRFLSAYGPISQHFRLRRHQLSACSCRQELKNRFQSWQEITTPALAAWRKEEEKPPLARLGVALRQISRQSTRAFDRRSLHTADSLLVGVDPCAWHHLIAGALDQ